MSCIRSALKFSKNNFLASHQLMVVKKCWSCSSHLLSGTFALASCQASFYEPLLLYRPASLMDLREGTDPGSLSMSELCWCWKQMNYQEKSQRQKSGQYCYKMDLAAAMLTMTRGVTHWCYCLVTSQGVDKTELVELEKRHWHFVAQGWKIGTSRKMLGEILLLSPLWAGVEAHQDFGCCTAASLVY